jgi:hypothetical protein
MLAARSTRTVCSLPGLRERYARCQVYENGMLAARSTRTVCSLPGLRERYVRCQVYENGMIAARSTRTVCSLPDLRERYARCHVYERCTRLISLSENVIMFVLVVFYVCELSPLSVLASDMVTTKQLTNF